MRNNKKALSPEQRNELLGALKACFEKNLNHHQGLDGHSMKWKELAVSRTLWVTTKKGENTFF